MNDDESNLPANRLWQPTTAKWFYVVFGGCVAYAVVRYHIAGDVAWRHLPTFIVNKATSLAAVIFVASSYLVGKTIRWYDDDKRLRLVVIKFCGLMVFAGGDPRRAGPRHAAAKGSGRRMRRCARRSACLAAGLFGDRL